MAPAIPERWEKYTPVGKPIEGTRFIAFKVPLREHVNKAVDYELRLDISGLLDKVPNLGIIIDLTNTDRYYNPEDFRREGVEYKKLNIPGHVTPPKYLVNKFKEFVMGFLNQNMDNDKLIGVHCTHGVNRTGYLICNYMISEMTIEPKEAIKKFGAARGHCIERENYLNALEDLLKLTTTLDENRSDSEDSAHNWRYEKNYRGYRHRNERDVREERYRSSRPCMSFSPCHRNENYRSSYDSHRRSNRSNRNVSNNRYGFYDNKKRRDSRDTPISDNWRDRP